VVSPSRDDQTWRPAQPDDGVREATGYGQADARDSRHDESAQVNLHLILLPGDRLSGAVGRLGDDDRRPFRGWLDLMEAIQQLRQR